MPTVRTTPRGTREFRPKKIWPVISANPEVVRSRLTRLVMRSLSAVSEAPDGTVGCRMIFGRALRIQRLEGSRPEGRLCTLNGAERVQRFKQTAVIGMICRFELLLERRSVAQKGSA